MKFTTLVRRTLGLGATLSLMAACSPATKQNEVKLNTDSTSIIGGEIVEKSDVISKSTVAIIASVVTADNEEGQFICTGSMLKSNIVLTAAHCVPEVGDMFKQVELFVIFNTDLHQMKPTDVRKVIDYAIHDDYGTANEFGEDDHDMALIKISGTMPAGYQLAKFLNDESVLKPGAKVTLAGYGLIETDGVNTKSDEKLRKVDVEIVEDFGKYEVLLDQTQGKGACHGDSGGPAFIELNGTQYVWGVTSRGAGKNGVDDCSLVSVYTKIKAESEFITKALNKLK